jgi:DNA-directed RNA polymerase subunit N (RpoN/RPB10)
MKFFYWKNETPYNEEDYTIKNKCATCGKPIKNNWNRFLLYGNYCFDCSALASFNSLDAMRQEGIRECNNLGEFVDVIGL